MGPVRRDATMAVGLLFALAGCSPRTATPAPEPKIKVVDVALGRAVGLDKRVTAASGTFAPTDAVYASVVIEGNAKRATLAARWTHQGAVLEQTSQDIAPRGTTVSEFHVFNPSGWAPGEYRVEILIEGRVVADRPFRVMTEKP
jgi:hypothetical protein